MHFVICNLFQAVSQSIYLVESLCLLLIALYDNMYLLKLGAEKLAQFFRYNYHNHGGHFAHIDNTEGVVGDLTSFIQKIQ